MQDLISVIPSKSHRMTDAECEKQKALFVINDERSSTQTAGSALWWQFWAHNVIDSTGPDDAKQNRYTGEDKLTGLYPARTDSPLLTKDGKFHHSSYGLPALTVNGNSGSYTEVAPDAHRANENPALKAHNFLFTKLHNRLVDEGDDYETAKGKVMSRVHQMSMNNLQSVTGFEPEEILRDIRIKDFHISLEFVFGAGRWAHAQMPDTVGGRPIFDKAPSISVDMLELYDGSEMARVLNRGVSRAMTQMNHVKSGPNIIDHTFGRHVDLGLPSWGDLVKYLKMKDDTSDNPNCPIWEGILLEAERNPRAEGTLGPVGARAIADAVAQSMLWAEPGQGLWHRGWPGAPVSNVDIIRYAA